MFRRILAAAAALAFLLPGAVHAAPSPVLLGDVGLCDPYYPTRCVKVGADGTVPISGSVTAGAAFAPTGQASLAVTTTTARVALPAASANVTLVNTGAQTAYFLLGNGSVVATTTTGYPLQSGSSITLAVGANTNVAAITSTSTTTLNVTSGTGVPALAGGGSTGGGGGGAVTVADGADVTQGALADAACATDNGTCTINAVIKRGNQRLSSMITALGSPFQAGGSIGNTTFASTQSGAWNITNVSGTVSLPTGASTAANQTTSNTNTGTTATNTGTIATNTGATTTALTAITGSKAAGTAAASAALTGGVFSTNGSLSLTNGQQVATQVDSEGSAKVALYDAAGAPLDSTLASAVQCGTTTGTMVQCALASNQVLPDTAGASRYPQAGTSNRTLTGTSLSSNTNTTICPTATNPVSTEIYFVVAGVGVGLNGQTLTGAAPTATTTNSPDFVSTAGMLYVAPLGISNAITAYGAAGVVRCVQTLRQ